jgi:YCII-related domain
MNKYFFLYTGGSQPTSEAEGKATTKAWMDYFGKIGPSIVDGGAPLAPSGKLLGKAGSSKATGYSIIQAASLDAAIALTKDHPHLKHGGGIEVLEVMKVPGM